MKGLYPIDTETHIYTHLNPHTG